MPTPRSLDTRAHRRPGSPSPSFPPARLPHVRAYLWLMAGGLGIFLLAARDPTILMTLLLVGIGLVAFAVLFDPGGDGREASRFTRACRPWAVNALLQPRLGTGDCEGSFGGEDAGDD